MTLATFLRGVSELLDELDTALGIMVPASYYHTLKHRILG